MTLSDVDCVNVSSYVFHFDCVLGQLKPCHLVRVYSTKLFGYRKFRLCPVCALEYITAYRRKRNLGIEM